MRLSPARFGVARSSHPRRGIGPGLLLSALLLLLVGSAPGCNAIEGAARGGNAFVGGLLSIFGVLALASLFLAILAVVWVRRRSLLGVAVISWALLLVHLGSVVALVEGAPTSSGLLPWYLRVVAGTTLLPVAAAACTTSLALVQQSTRRLRWVPPLVVMVVLVVHGGLLWSFILARDPLGVLTPAPALEVKVGPEHGCSLHDDGTVTCWGLNDDGQLGDGTQQTVEWPVMVAGMTDAVSLAVGEGRTCVRRRGGQIACWGRNAGGSVVERPTDIAEGIQAGPWFAGARIYAVDGSGLLVSGQVELEPQVPLPPVAQLAAGLRHVCVQRGDGHVSCWGDGTRGQLGAVMEVERNAPVEESDRPRLKLDQRVPVPGLDDAETLVAGDHHTCAMRRSGEVVCWGLRDEGEQQCRDGCTMPGPLPVGVSDAVEVSAGAKHTCALRVTGAVVCWGDDRWGQLGQGGFATSREPVEVPLPGPAVAVFANGYATCVVLADDAVRCWGASRSGSLGVRGLEACRARRVLASSECATTPQPLWWTEAATEAQ